MLEPKDFGRVALLYGGTSAEREVSLLTGGAVLAAMQRKRVEVVPFDFSSGTLLQLANDKFDRVFIALHGRGGEDGQVQGALQTMGLPYTGSGILGSALAMDKWRTKLLWQACSVNTPNYRILQEDSDFTPVVRALGLPLIVKPAAEGSTIGLTKVTEASAMGEAYARAAACNSAVLAEEFISGYEYTASILKGQCLPLVRIQPKGDLYDYEAKYNRDDTQYFCPAGLAEDQERILQAEATHAFSVLGCSGWGRVDLIVDQKSGKPHFLEANTVPGMTSHSLVPMAARAAGIEFDDLVLRILETSMPHGHDQKSC